MCAGRQKCTLQTYPMSAYDCSVTTSRPPRYQRSRRSDPRSDPQSDPRRRGTKRRTQKVTHVCGPLFRVDQTPNAFCRSSIRRSTCDNRQVSSPPAARLILMFFNAVSTNCAASRLRSAVRRKYSGPLVKLMSWRLQPWRCQSRKEL